MWLLEVCGYYCKQQYVVLIETSHYGHNQQQIKSEPDIVLPAETQQHANPTAKK
jgi:hypothetical protein